MRKSIKAKILGVFILIFIVLVGNSIWAITNFNKLSNSIESIMQSNYRSIVAAQHMIVALERQDSAQLSYLFAAGEEAVEVFRENEKEFIKQLTRAEDNITEQGESEILKDINSYYTQYIHKFSVFTEILKDESPGDARNYYYRELFPLFEDTKSACRDLELLNQNAMIYLKDRAHEIAKRASYLTLIISMTTSLGGILLVIYLINRIIRPISNLTEKVKQISEGNYTQKIDITTNDEIGQLADEFNIMTEKLKSYDEVNINKLMKEKQKAEAIVESISDGIIVTDEHNRILLVNKAGERAFDIRQQDVLNKHFLEVINREDMFKLIDKVKNRDNKDEYKKYTDIAIKDQEKKKYYRINVTAIKNREGKNIGVVTLMQDITKIKEVEQLKSDFVSTVSHEFRTPLTSISMGVGLLLDNVVGEINEEQKELLDAIKEDGERLKNLVSDLLDLSRLQSGKMQMDIQPHNANRMIDNAIKTLGIQAQDKNITLMSDVEENLPEVEADFNKILWVLTNLIGNALRYTPNNGNGKIIISAKESGNKLLLLVADNGKGIPEDWQQKIFEKFIQVKDENGETVGGTGLGLAISKEIINAHGGEIWVQSKMGEGSTFYFTLNIAK